MSQWNIIWSNWDLRRNWAHGCRRWPEVAEHIRRPFSPVQVREEIFLPHLVTRDEKWVTYVSVNGWIQGRHQVLMRNPTPIKRKIMLCFLGYRRNGELETAGCWNYPYARHIQSATWKGCRCTSSETAAEVEGYPADGQLAIAKLTRSKIHDLGCEILPHPHYSPDFAPSDYYQFRTLNNKIGGQQFDSDGALKTWLTNFFASKPMMLYERGIRKLLVKCGDMVHNNGDYNKWKYCLKVNRFLHLKKRTDLQGKPPNLSWNLTLSTVIR